jgi:Uma2 family endonuclease
MIKITTGLIRIPDVTFISWDHLPGRAIPAEPIPKVPIDLAVEVLSKSNTRREMKRKLGDYVASGARLVWYIDPRKRTARVYAADDEGTEIGEDDSLEGGEVLPGFSLPLRTLLDSARGAPQA